MSTLRDVAKMSGVSTATVSNVLNARTEKVSTETRERVMQAVRALKYRPTPLERNQAAILTKNIAVIFGELSQSPVHRTPYFSEIFDGILHGTVAHGWSVTVFVEEMWTEGTQSVRRSYDGRCDGAIVIAPNPGSPFIKSLCERGISVVSVGTSAESVGGSSVDVDNAEAAFAATNYLLELGHTRVAYLGPYNRVVQSSAERLKGFRRAMRTNSKSGLLLEFFTDSTSRKSSERQLAESGERYQKPWAESLVSQMLDSPEQLPTAMFCWNDELARHVIRHLIQLGFSVPGDFSVVGFDDTPLSISDHPSLTTVHQPFREIGHRAADLLLSRILDIETSDQTIHLPTELVVRQSTAPPSQRSPKSMP